METKFPVEYLWNFSYLELDFKKLGDSQETD